MATHRPRFVFDRPPDADVLGQRFDRELSLRWQFVQAQADKSLPFVLLPRLRRPPQHPEQAPTEEPTDGIYVIADELKSLYKDRRLALNGRTSCQEQLAETLGRTWHFIQSGTLTNFPSNFRCRHKEKPGTVPSLMTQEDHRTMSINEMGRLEGLITMNRYDWFYHWEKKARDGIKLAEDSISKLEAGMTRQHNTVSKEYEAWLEKNGDNPIVLNAPFEGTPDVDTDSAWHAWFRLEEQLLSARRALEMEKRAQGWVFRDMLAAMTNGLIDRGEMDKKGPLTIGKK